MRRAFTLIELLLVIAIPSDTTADDLVNRARQAQRRVPDADAVAGLLPVADDIADNLEEAIFLITLLRDL